CPTVTLLYRAAIHIKSTTRRSPGLKRIAVMISPAPLRRLDIPKALAIVVDHYLSWRKLVKSFRLSIPLQQLHKLIRRNYGSEIAVDAVHGGGFVFGTL